MHKANAKIKAQTCLRSFFAGDMETFFHKVYEEFTVNDVFVTIENPFFNEDIAVKVYLSETSLERWLAFSEVDGWSKLTIELEEPLVLDLNLNGLEESKWN